MYETGTPGFPRDDQQAAEWYRRASERNFADAQTKLAPVASGGRRKAGTSKLNFVGGHFPGAIERASTMPTVRPPSLFAHNRAVVTMVQTRTGVLPFGR